MFRRRALFGGGRALALVLSCLPIGLGAHSVLDFDDWMQRIDDGSQDLQRRIAARDRDGASNAAREVAELYGLMETYFAKRVDSEAAVRYSREGREFAATALKHLNAGNYRAARENALRIAHGCRACHIEYKPL